MASPGETIHCKLSVMAGALFHLRPLPPYHHVPDVDKQGTRTDPSYDTAIQGVRLKKRSSVPSPPPINEVTTTTLSDFWPHMGRVIGKAANSKVTPEMVLTRPPLLGIELIPRDDMYVKLDQREEWEFVLRHCFVQEAQPIGDVIPSLGFGAENLLPKIAESAETSKYVGEPVDLSLQTRAVNVEQWARIVDVFAKWPFKPDVSVCMYTEANDSSSSSRQESTRAAKSGPRNHIEVATYILHITIPLYTNVTTLSPCLLGEEFADARTAHLCEL